MVQKCVKCFELKKYNNIFVTKIKTKKHIYAKWFVIKNEELLTERERVRRLDLDRLRRSRDLGRFELEDYKKY